MAETFNKKEREKKRELKRKEKQLRKDNRKDNVSDGSLDSMMAYVDEYGNIVDTPPDPTKVRKEIDASSIELGVPKRIEEEYDPILKGMINYFDATKGYGFIKGDDEESFFVHQNDIAGLKPAKGQRVTFEKKKGAKGWVAYNVNLLK